MANQEDQEREQRQRDVQPASDREPREGIQDERSLADASPPGGDGPTVDESQERNEKVDEEIDADEEDLGLRSEKDGGFASEDLPVVRVGEVYEDVRPAEDDHRRYVKIIDAEADKDGRVLVQNEETYRLSRIRLDRFTPENGWARFAS
jgi:hypothetical protein